jgi:hypothetical protein
MVKEKKKKKPKKIESEKESSKKKKKNNDYDFDKLSKKDMIKIKKLSERIQEKRCNLNNKKSILLAKFKISRL